MAVKYPLQVIPYDGLFRYHVTSARYPDKQYLVDLEHYHGNGCCSCENFAIKHEPRIVTDGYKPKRDECRCKHLIAARDYLGRMLIRAVLSERFRAERELGKGIHTA